MKAMRGMQAVSVLMATNPIDNYYLHGVLQLADSIKSLYFLDKANLAKLRLDYDP